MIKSFSFNKNNLGPDPIVCPPGVGGLRLAGLILEPSSKGFARITQVDAPPNPKVAQFFKE
jgi:hypothetical protein